MSEQANFGSPEGSLDRVELLMAIEEALFDRSRADPPLAPTDRKWLMREIAARIERGEFGGMDDLDDDALAALVRKLGPRSPRGQAGAAVRPEPFSE